MEITYITQNGKRVENITFRGEHQRITASVLKHIGYAIHLMNTNLFYEEKLKDITPESDMVRILKRAILAPEGFLEGIGKSGISIDEQLDLIKDLDLQQKRSDGIHTQYEPGKYNLEITLNEKQFTEPVKKDFALFTLDGDQLSGQVPYKNKQSTLQKLARMPRHVYDVKLLSTLEDAITTAYDLKNPTITIHDYEKNIFPFGIPEEANEKDMKKTMKIKEPEELLKLYPHQRSTIRFSPQSKVWTSQRRKGDAISRVLTYGFKDVNTGAENQPSTYRTIKITGTMPTYWKI
ncbi:MAG: hypothetical protein ACOCZV_00425 [Nanoarchaeota archaeon]